MPTLCSQFQSPHEYKINSAVFVLEVGVQRKICEGERTGSFYLNQVYCTLGFPCPLLDEKINNKNKQRALNEGPNSPARVFNFKIRRPQSCSYRPGEVRMNRKTIILDKTFTITEIQYCWKLTD